MKTFSAVCISGIGLCLACGGGGGSNTGSATVVGNINGRAFQAADAISGNVSIPLGPPINTLNGSAIAIASNGGLCGLLSANKEPKNSQYLVVVLTDLNLASMQSTAPSTPGIYTVYSGTGTLPSKLALVTYVRTDANCAAVASEQGTDGTVTVSTINNGAYSGTFDVHAQPAGGGTVDHVSGTFNAASCPGLGPLVSTTQNTTCI